MLQSLWAFIKRYPKYYIPGASLAILSSFLYIVPNYIIQEFIDHIVSGSLTQSTFGWLLTAFAVFTILIFAADASWVLLIFGRSYAYQHQLRSKGYASMVNYRALFYETFRSGDLMTKMTSDIDSLGTLLGFGLMVIVADGSILLTFLAVMIYTVSIEVTLLSVLPLIIFGVLIYFVSREVDKRYDLVRDAVADLSNEVLEVVDGVRVMRAYGRFDLEQARFQAKTREVSAKADRLVVLYGLFGQLAKLFGGISMAIGLAYCSYLVSVNQLTVGQLVSFQLYLGMLNGSIWGMSEIVVVYQQAKVSYDKFNELLKATDHMEANGDKQLDRIDGIEFNHYQFQYPSSENTNLEDITFKLKRGQTLGIVGRTGSGKTTLVKQLLRQYPIGQGDILINGQAMQSYHRESVERQIGYVPQEHILFSQTIQYNIEFGTQDNLTHSQRQLIEAIGHADFTKDLERMPQGLETMIGEKGVAISGGQKQRVAIARALIRQPELLILDDSLSAVDAKTERAIIDNINQLRADKTNIIISHRLSAVAGADLILVMDEGRIIEHGTSTQLIEQKGWYFEQFENQQAQGGETD